MEYIQQWDQLIRQAQYAYNDITNRSTRKILFEIVYGLHPRVVYELRDLNDRVKKSGYNDDFVYAMKEVHEIVRKTLAENTMKHKAKVDETRREVECNVGDLIMVHLNKS